MAYPTNNLRIKSSRVVLPPIFLEEEMPVTENASRTVFEARRQAVDILKESDDRLIVVVGPCSIHDPIANLHNLPRQTFSSSDYRALRSEAMIAWREIAELGIVA